jgi:hypothetical protein
VLTERREMTGKKIGNGGTKVRLEVWKYVWRYESTFHAAPEHLGVSSFCILIRWSHNVSQYGKTLFYSSQFCTHYGMILCYWGILLEGTVYTYAYLHFAFLPYITSNLHPVERFYNRWPTEILRGRLLGILAHTHIPTTVRIPRHNHTFCLSNVSV